MSSILRGEKGTSTLEFIVVFPFLLLIFLAGVELSRAWLTATVAANAVREGARIGAVTPAADVVAIATARINDVLSAANLTAVAGPTVTCNPAPCDPLSDSRVQATVTVQFQTVVPLFIPLLASLNINQSATMRYE